MNDRHIDDAIDRTVREIMHVESGSATRARVLASLEGPERRHRRWTWATAAAAAALVLAVLVMRGPRHETSSAIATAPERPAPHAVSPGERSPVPPDYEQAPSAAPPIVRRAPGRTVAGAVAPELPETIPALADIDALVVPPPRAGDIEPEDVVILPLAEIPEIEFAPLGFPPEPRD